MGACSSGIGRALDSPARGSLTPAVWRAAALAMGGGNPAMH